jgi:hypothetical protein
MTNNPNNNILLNNMNPQLKRLFDSSNDAPKLIKKGGQFTKSFLTWNKKKLKQGLTIFYADPNFFYDPITERIKKKQLKKSGEERAASKRLPRQGSTLIKNTGEYEREFLPENYSDGLYLDTPINTYRWWYPLLKQFEGQTIRIIIKYYIKDPNQLIGNESAKEFIEGLQSKYSGAYNFVYDNTFTIPTNFTNSKFNTGKWYYEFMVDSNWPNIVAFLLANNIKTRVIITKLLDLPDKKIFQSFREGPTHCVLKPILDYFENALLNQPSKSQKIKNQTAVNNIKGKYLKKSKTHKEGFLDKYEQGIPEKDLQNLCDTLQIGIKIDKPFSKNQYINIRSHQKPRKVFKYVNSSIDHTEISRNNHKLTTNDYSEENIIEMDKDQLEKKRIELKENLEYYIYSRNKWGLTTIKTFDAIYRLPNEYLEICKDFDKENNINSFKINALKYPNLQKFINRGSHFNCTIDFQDLPDITNPELRHIDIYKAYTQYKKCKYYDGFLGKITDFRQVDNYKEKGYYFIDNLSFTNANKKFVFYNNKLKWFKNNNIYTDAELRFLKDQGATFKVFCGAYGLKTEFSFPDKMIDGKILLTKVNKEDIKIMGRGPSITKL